jgi:hypothetical protein
MATALSRRELRRFVLNPVLLVGVALAVWAVWANYRTPPATVDEVTPFSAIFVGAFAMAAAYWLTRSMGASAAVVDVTPTSMPARTAAICWSAVVPGLCGVVFLVEAAVFQPFPAGQWGTLDAAARIGVLVGQILLPAVGGPLLGVALGRWVSFPGAAFLVFLVVYGWVSLCYIVTAAHPSALWATALRLFSPFAFFLSTDSFPNTVTTLNGSPWWYVAFQTCLSAIAVLVAMLRGAEGTLRRRLGRGLAVLGAGAVIAYILAVVL